MGEGGGERRRVGRGWGVAEEGLELGVEVVGGVNAEGFEVRPEAGGRCGVGRDGPQ